MRGHFEQVAHDTRLGKVEANWSSKEKEAFKDLQRAAEAFFQASSVNEVEVPTRGAGAALEAEIVQIDARADLNDAFVADLEKFEQGQLPRFSAAQFKKSDAELNSLYKLRVQPLDPDPDAAPESVTPEGVKTAQRAWLRYREAWVAFGQVKYPSVTADSWRTWVTQQRTDRWKNGG